MKTHHLVGTSVRILVGRCKGHVVTITRVVLPLYGMLTEHGLLWFASDEFEALQ